MTEIDGKPVRKGMAIAGVQCDALFDLIVARFFAALKRGMNVPVGQDAFDALMSVG